MPPEAFGKTGRHILRGIRTAVCVLALWGGISEARAADEGSDNRTAPDKNICGESAPKTGTRPGHFGSDFVSAAEIRPNAPNAPAENPAADIATAADSPRPSQRRAGEEVTREEILREGEAAFWKIDGIGTQVFARMKGRSYKQGCRLPLGELRYLRVLHHDFEGRILIGEIVCNRLIAEDLMEIFRTLYRHAYPICRMVLIDDYEASDRRSMLANNTSAFNYREVRNTGKLSNHSYGMAIDINPLFNPCVIRRKDGSRSVDPPEGRKYADRSRPFAGRIDHDDLCYKEFRKRGFIWGGDWRSLKDYQHFEKKQER